jgi:hypothetical protein
MPRYRTTPRIGGKIAARMSAAKRQHDRLIGNYSSDENVSPKRLSILPDSSDNDAGDDSDDDFDFQVECGQDSDGGNSSSNSSSNNSVCRVSVVETPQLPPVSALDDTINVRPIEKPTFNSWDDFNADLASYEARTYQVRSMPPVSLLVSSKLIGS